LVCTLTDDRRVFRLAAVVPGSYAVTIPNITSCFMLLRLLCAMLADTRSLHLLRLADAVLQPVQRSLCLHLAAALPG
jgi:hypothetical protein